MQPNNSNSRVSPKLALILFLIGAIVVLLLSVLIKRPQPAEASTSSAGTTEVSLAVASPKRSIAKRALQSTETKSAEEEVAERLAAFSQNRRELAHRYAAKLGITVPTELEAFFDAADRGNWEEIDRLYKGLQDKRNDSSYPDAKSLQKLFATAQEVWGAHAAAHEWPAQALLDYGRDTLGSLAPDMVYIGGTDPGRFIPTLLNATSGDKHIVLTQNALADGTYLEYINFLYGDRLKTLTASDSSNSFQKYLADVAKRYQHDQEFPNEPKQMRPGENYLSKDGRVQVSGIGSVMSVNELLLLALQEKNPDLKFAMEESFSLPSTYSNTIPRGALLELGNENSTTKLTAPLASAALDFWRNKINQITTAPDFDPAKETGREYSHMIVAQGNLFSSHNLNSEAEQAYRLAQQLANKYDLEPTRKLYELLKNTGRSADADAVLAQFAQTYPDQAEAVRAIRK